MKCDKHKITLCQLCEPSGEWKKFFDLMETANPLSSMHLRPEVECMDGFKMSVQASERHYCTPREWLPAAEYSKWEVWADDNEPSLAQYKGRNGECGWVPIETVIEVIVAHGGIKS